MRTKLPFVTIDEYDRCAPGERGHANNLLRLRAVAGEWARRRGTRLDVAPLHFTRVSLQTLEDPELLALFLAGSWPEWLSMNRPMGKHHDEPRTYGDALAPFMELVRRTTVPILAVCGSHHLVAAAYSGFRAVGHMLAGAARPTIDDELREDTSFIPVPRPGEIGAFAVERAAGAGDDPLLAGMDGPLHFIQHHHDEVVEEHLSSELRVILRPAEGTMIQDVVTREGHRPLAGFGERCRVQGLRHVSKLLYTLQLHPDLAAAVVAPELDPRALQQHASLYASCDANGAQLLARFFDLAAAHWQT